MNVSHRISCHHFVLLDPAVQKSQEAPAAQPEPLAPLASHCDGRHDEPGASALNPFRSISIITPAEFVQRRAIKRSGRATSRSPQVG
jgi:hypothetical protein